MRSRITVVRRDTAAVRITPPPTRQIQLVVLRSDGVPAQDVHLSLGEGGVRGARPFSSQLLPLRAEPYRAAVEAKVRPGDPFDPTIEFVGGFLCAYGHPDEEERIQL